MIEKIEEKFSLLWRPCDVGSRLFMCGKDLITPFLPPRRCCEASGGLFKCQRRSRKQFSSMWRPCEVGASLFMCGKLLLLLLLFSLYSIA